MGLVNRAFRNIFRKKTRTLFVAVSLGFLITMIIAVETGVDASKSKTQTMIDDVKGTFNETSESIQTQLTQISVMNISGLKGRPGGKLRGGSPISQADIDEISSFNSVEDVVPTITQTYGEIDYDAIKRDDPDAKQRYMEMFDFIVNGVSLDPELDNKYNILPSNIVEGVKLTEDDTGGVLIKEELKTFFDAGVGDLIEINNISFEIIGVYSSEAGAKNIYMSLTDAQELLEYKEGDVNLLNIYAVNESSVDKLVADLGEEFPDFYFAPGGFFKGESAGNVILSVEEQVEQLEEDMKRIESTGNLIVLLSTVAAAFIILFMMAYVVKERTKEIGVLKAIGFTRNNIMSQFVIEGTVIGLLGGVFGIVIGFVATPSLSSLLFSRSEDIVSTPGIMIIGFALCLTVVLGALGSLYPAYQASRKSPMEAMRNDWYFSSRKTK